MEEHPKLTHPTYLAYLVALVLSFLLLLIGQTLRQQQRAAGDTGFCSPHYRHGGAALLYGSRKRKTGRPVRARLPDVFRELFCIEPRAQHPSFHYTWFAIYLLVVTPSLLLFRYMSRLPAWARVLTGFFAGLALLAYVYLALFLLPLYPISIPAAVCARLFYPYVCARGAVLSLLVRRLKRYRLWKSALAGLAAGLAVVAVFCVIYNQRAPARTRCIYNHSAKIQGAGLLHCMGERRNGWIRMP